MKGNDIKAAREAMGLSISEFADRLGLAGANAADYVRQMENGSREISGPIARLTMALLDGWQCPEEKFWPDIINAEHRGERV